MTRPTCCITLCATVSALSNSAFNRLRAPLFATLSLAYLFLIFGCPLLLCGMLWKGAVSRWQIPLLLICPIVYAVVFALVAALLSIPHQKGIIAGKFPRDVGNPVYFHRRLYGLCWTALFYCKPVYFIVLSIEPLRHCVFRLFGYRGKLNFTIYPDTWIRDLPLLDFGEGAYIANRSTLGSNICLQSGEILVGRISIGDRSVLGHLAVIGLDSKMDSDSEIGVGTTTGIQVTVGRGTKVGAICGLNHGSSIGDECDVGSMSYIGSGTRVHSGVHLPAASVSPDYVTIKDASQVSRIGKTESERQPCLSDEAWLQSSEVRRVLDVLRTATQSLKNAIFHPNDNLESDLGLDSLRRVELLPALERALGVEIQDRVVLECKTLRELVDGVFKAQPSEQGSCSTHRIFDCQPSVEDIKCLERRRIISAPLWFLIGRGIESVGKVFFGLQIVGREKLPGAGPFILCPNHQSYLDPPLILSLLPWRIYRNLFLIGTSDIFGTGLFAMIAKTVRLYPVDSDRNLLPAMRISALGLRRGMGLLLYPEGERSVDGRPKQFKNGAGILAANLNVPIYPVAIDGFFDAWPRGRGFTKFATLKIAFGDPIVRPIDVDVEKAQQLMTEKLQATVFSMWKELRDEHSELSRGVISVRSGSEGVPD